MIRRMTIGHKWTGFVAAIGSGLMVAGLFPPFNLWPLVWIAMMPLLWALGKFRGRRAALKGFGIAYFAGAVSCLIQFNWLTTVSWLGAILLPLYLAIYWGLFGLFVAWLAQRSDRNRLTSRVRIAFCHAAIWGGLEWLRGWFITGFAWNQLGVGFHEVQVFAQAADLLGVTGLSAILVFIQSLLVQSLTVETGRPQKWLAFGLVVLLITALWGYGKFAIAREAGKKSVQLKTLLVQLNIPQVAGRMLWTDLETHQAYEDETLAALDRLKTPNGELGKDWPDWVMGPETALTGRILRTKEGAWGTWQINMDTVSQIRSAGPVTLIYGVNEIEGEGNGSELAEKPGGKYYNSMAVMSPDNGLQTFRKHHLVVFGETIPFVNTFPLLRKIYEQQSGMSFGGSFAPGESLEPLQILVGNTMVGAIPTICFEDSVGRLTRKFVRRQPQVLVNVTNDGWFKESPAAAQHFANSRFRAIELRRPMLRCANTGVSVALNSAGSAFHPTLGEQILTDSKGSHFTRGTRLTKLEIPLDPTRTFYAFAGDWGILAVTGLGVLASCRGVRNGGSRSAAKDN